MKIACLLVLTISSQFAAAQVNTDVSLFLKKNKQQDLREIESRSGNMFRKAGHHGPAIENEWFALRIYFNKTSAVDVYSKSKPGLELAAKKWYPSKKDQKAGWGADYYKVGKSAGLGGVKLWDGSRVIDLNPVSVRTARVGKEGGGTFMEMISKGVPYKGEKVNILVRITAVPKTRKMKIEAHSETGKEVQFVTGINYHKGVEVDAGKNYIATWGIHPEDVAAEKIAVGAALIFREEEFSGQVDDGRQILLIAKPSRTMVTWVTSCNEKEPEMNSFAKLIGFISQNRE